MAIQKKSKKRKRIIKRRRTIKRKRTIKRRDSMKRRDTMKSRRYSKKINKGGKIPAPQLPPPQLPPPLSSGEIEYMVNKLNKMNADNSVTKNQYNHQKQIFINRGLPEDRILD